MALHALRRSQCGTATSEMTTSTLYSHFRKLSSAVYQELHRRCFSGWQRRVPRSSTMNEALSKYHVTKDTLVKHTRIDQLEFSMHAIMYSTSIREHRSPRWFPARFSARLSFPLLNLAAVRVKIVHLTLGLRRRRAQLKPRLARVEVFAQRGDVSHT